MKPSTKTTFNQNNFQPVNLQPVNLQPVNLQPANLQPANLGQRPRYANNLLTYSKGIYARLNDRSV
ncbi:MAG: hypothetical protein F6K50_17490 [Moorea sp. SIO3I7]|uniref:hypothetical protein n=1 Tax=Moorena bouillonii TaxID=207920 RepID=UPI00117ECFEA|nr:hypothetical protein [Moorena bouillonii]NEN97253.1 hypothetical protein [Moorena sp. SIO3I7]